MKLTGAQILIETLIEQGVEVIFGYPGGSVLNIYDALYENSHRIRHILTSHEQGAAHAADGYARSSGKTGVVFATSGPGATNLVTGIATAYMDSIPIIAVTGNVPLDLMGRDSFQEVDITGITMPVTKHNYIVKDVNDLADIIREAFVIANSGRPGPVLIDIPKDITAKTGEYIKGEPFKRREIPPPPQDLIDSATEMINESSKPLIFAGGGVVSSGAYNELGELSEKMDSPVSLSIMGISALKKSCPRNLGMIGMHGTPVSNKAVLTCDLLITVGARFSDRVTGNREKFAPNAKIIHIDVDPSEQGKNVRSDLSIPGDAGKVMKMLKNQINAGHNGDWMHELMAYKAHTPMPYAMDIEKVNIREVLNEIHSAAGDDAVVVTDVGQHQIITAQYYRFSKPRSFISSCGLGTMGYGMGAAIGAKTANPDNPVILITGDGSFHMNMNEMACAVSENIPIVVIVMNNGVLGMVRQWQRLFYDGRYSNTGINRKTDYVKLAHAFGASGFRIAHRADIKPVLQKALKLKKPCIIDCIIDKDDSVFPIIPPGGTQNDIIFCD